MTRDQFWALIEKARDRAGDRPGRMCDALRAELENQMPAEVAAFAAMLRECVLEADTWDLRAATHMLRDRYSEDDFDAFRYWLIAQGETTFERVLARVEALAEHNLGVHPPEDCFFREFGRVPHEVYEEMTGEAVSRVDDSMPGDPGGKAWTPRDLPSRFPRLWARLAGRLN
ncbi:MAG: DUF4240 domain-containing protein [Planctomycetes bacterium]|nr:DUF4240 domain-containing protein [Planctomycetota bacterium]